MKVSELIEKLQDKLITHGDCNVSIAMFDFEYGCLVFQDVTKVDFDNNFNDGSERIIIE